MARFHTHALIVASVPAFFVGVGVAIYIGGDQGGTAVAAGAQRIVSSASGGKVIPTPSLAQISTWSGGARTQRLVAGALTVQAPQSYRLNGTLDVPLALKAARTGNATLAVLCTRATFAHGTMAFAGAGASGFRLTLAKRTPLARCALSVSFRARRAAKTATTRGWILMQPPVPVTTPTTPTTPAPAPAPTPTPTTTTTSPTTTITTTRTTTTTSTTTTLPPPVADTCIRPLVTDPPAGSDVTEISAELDGPWPIDPVVHAQLEFVDDPSTIWDAEEEGQILYLEPPAGENPLVLGVKVWVTGDNTSGIVCNGWLRRF